MSEHSGQYEDFLEAMQGRYRQLAGFLPDDASDIGVRLKVLAGELAVLCAQAGELREQVFPQTSSGEYLELHAQTRGIRRKPAQAARGMLRFSRAAPAAVDIPIEAGVLCAARGEEPERFETAEAAVLAAGALWVEVPARAAEPGAGGNVQAGAVCLMVTPPPGLTAVANPAAFSGGVDGESDESLRRRLLFAYENISNSTNKAYYYNLAMEEEGVASVNVLPRERGRGTVDVVFAGDSPGEEEALARRLEALLEEKKEINVDVKVYGAQRGLVDVAARIAVEEGYDFSTVAARCREALEEALEGMAVGEGLVLARLGNLLYGVEGVRNYRLEKPEEDIATPGSHVIRLGTVSVERMAGG